jgi:hypothetical protein
MDSRHVIVHGIPGRSPGLHAGAAGDNPTRQADAQGATGYTRCRHACSSGRPTPDGATPVGVDSWSGSGALCKIEASTTYQVSSQLTSTVPCVGGASGSARMVPMPCAALKPRDTSTACRDPLWPNRCSRSRTRAKRQGTLRAPLRAAGPGRGCGDGSASAHCQRWAQWRRRAASHHLCQRAAVTGRCARRKSRTWRTASGIRFFGSFQG